MRLFPRSIGYGIELAYSTRRVWRICDSKLRNHANYRCSIQFNHHLFFINLSRVAKALKNYCNLVLTGIEVDRSSEKRETDPRGAYIVKLLQLHDWRYVFLQLFCIVSSVDQLDNV